MKTRLVYIDILKGIAIFLVVMGHFLSWTFTEKPQDVLPSIVREIIYAFHMPLFMFLSGYVVDLRKKTYSLSGGMCLLKKRLVTLLLPCMSWFVISGFNEVPWFLRALFEIMVVYVICRSISLLFKRYRNYVELILFILGYLVIFVITRVIRGTGVDDIFNMTQFQIMYPYFIMGYIFRKYELGPLIIKRGATCAIIGFISFFYLYHYTTHTDSVHAIYRYILGGAGVFCIYIIVASIKNYDNIMSRALALCGKYSIEIYLVSYYCIPRLYLVGDYILLTAKTDMYTSISIQIVSGFVVSVYATMMCILFAKFIGRSNFLNLIMFGKQ